MIIMKPSPVSIKLVSESNGFDFKSIYRKLSSAVVPAYPDFQQWFYFTFRPGFISGEREMIIAHSRNEIVGLSLIKNSPLERKICTFYIDPRHREQGIGLDLMSVSMELLQNNIVITASEDRFYELSPLLKKFNFELEKNTIGLYKKNKTENHYRSV